MSECKSLLLKLTQIILFKKQFVLIRQSIFTFHLAPMLDKLLLEFVDEYPLYSIYNFS